MKNLKTKLLVLLTSILLMLSLIACVDRIDDEQPLLVAVTFSCGTSITEGNFEIGSYLDELVVFKDGHILAGWYLDQAFTLRWDFDNDTVTGPKTLFARWEQRTSNENNESIYFIVSFDTLGDEQVDEIEVENNTLFKIDVLLRREGYVLKGWMLDGVLVDQILVNRDILLVASWMQLNPAELITISFDTQGLVDVDCVQIVKGSLLLKLPVVATAGLISSHWVLNGDVFDLYQPLFEDVILAVRWRVANSWTVTFDTGLADPIEAMAINEGQPIALPIIHLEGYTFRGWLNIENQEPIFLTAAPAIQPIITNDMRLEAWFTQTEWRIISFDTKGGNDILDLIAEFALPLDKLPIPDRFGFAFDGWLLNDQPFDIRHPVFDDMNLVASWRELNVFVVEFDVNGGDSVDNIYLVEGDYLDNLPTPKKDGFVFAGWYLSFDFSERFESGYITADIRLVARWLTSTIQQGVTYGAFLEALWVNFPDTNSRAARAYYSYAGQENWILVDAPLVRPANRTGFGRVDIVGLRSTYYDIRVINSAGQTSLIRSVFTGAFDRSGYAHFGTDVGVGAYNNDGTLKDNALVVYIDDHNKNLVTVPGIIPSGGRTGIGWILNNYDHGSNPNTLAHFNRPISFRFLGRVNVPDGVTLRASTERGGARDHNGDMVRMRNANNITIGGIGYDAEWYGWGVHLIASVYGRGQNFEVRNLTFTNYSEDAVGHEGHQRPYYFARRGWFHHNRFNRGYHPNPTESDKRWGDGALDFRRGMFFTVAYNQFFETDKTGLIGGDDQDLTWHVTMHHNHYRNFNGRVPLARAANIHFYNNFLEITNDNPWPTGHALSIRMNALVFSEANFFLATRSTFRQVSGGQILSYNDVTVSFRDDDDNQRTILSSRMQTVNTNNRFGNFHVNPNVFMFCSTTQRSDVKRLTCAVQARADVLAFAGPFRATGRPAFADFVPLDNRTPELITQQREIVNVDWNAPRPYIVFRVLVPTEVSITWVRGESTVLLCVYGIEHMRNNTTSARRVIIQPGTYMIKSARTFGGSTSLRGVHTFNHARTHFHATIRPLS